MRETRTVKAALDHAAAWHPDTAAFVQADRGTSLTYSAANDRANRFANALTTLGVDRGNRIVFLAQTTVDHAVAYLALSKIGAVGATVHARESRNRIRSTVEALDPRALVFDPAYEDIARWIERNADVDCPALGFDDRGHVPDFAMPVSSLLEDAPSDDPSTVVGPDDPAYVNFTSGSTGSPTGVVHTHGEVIESAHLGQYCAGFRSDDVFLNVRSPSFIGWSNWQFSVLNSGASTVFVDEWDPERVVDVVEREPITFLVLTPTQWKMALRAGIGERDTSSLRLVAYAGETLNEALLRRLHDDVTETVFAIYGSTETMCSGTVLYPDSLTPETVDSVGKPLPNVDVRIVAPGSGDPDATVEPGETGELVVRGPSVTGGYLRDDGSHPVRGDGWWFSGDLAHVGSDGNLYLEGRVDNVIVSGGINVQAEQVENVLEAHPSVVEAGVVGVPHDEWTRSVKAFVVAGDDVDADALDEWCRENDDLADFKRPREYEFRSELPRTNTDKLDRRSLRADRG